MTKKLIKDIIKYIEDAEMYIDQEVGYHRDVKGLIEGDKMPKVYYELKELLK